MLKIGSPFLSASLGFRCDVGVQFIGIRLVLLVRADGAFHFKTGDILVERNNVRYRFIVYVGLDVSSICFTFRSNCATHSYLAV